ncbi:hypothetical protein GFL38_10450 [Rhizobium leguminosarum bv. viciae]|uniref:hypothetical protein n=1 Tax=Rhizobium ruizarguesonis TaxID=2081791 RepID=UPI00143F7D55|nr:hypothetical protein [Rhizobium ruizarguesonis]NKJ72684.1 hypothetical protein [Rhizobium leguminosarum bv. viciae]NKQ80361.1 hypothetical protein [Rhizobium ruizarguesonis]
MNLNLGDKPSDLHKSYLFTTEKMLLPSVETIERTFTALEPDDLTTIGKNLMKMSGQILDQFREWHGFDASKTFSAPTMVQNYRVTGDGLMATMGLVNRRHPLSFMIVDRNTFWVPLDILAGTGTETKPGVCTPMQIVDFLGGKRWQQILTDKLKIVSVVYDAWARHANTPDDRVQKEDEIGSSSPADDRSGAPFPHNATAISALRPLINRLIARVSG